MSRSELFVMLTILTTARNYKWITRGDTTKYLGDGMDSSFSIIETSTILIIFAIVLRSSYNSVSCHFHFSHRSSHFSAFIFELPVFTSQTIELLDKTWSAIFTRDHISRFLLDFEVVYRNCTIMLLNKKPRVTSRQF